MDDATRDEIQKRLDSAQDLNGPMVEALQADGADTDEQAEQNFLAWIDARNKSVIA